MHSNHKVGSNGFVILTGTANPELAIDVGLILDKKISEPISAFADGEIRVQVPERLFKEDVFIIQPTSPPVNDHIMELLLMIDAVKRATPSEITIIIPYFGYSRQDRKDAPRVPISSAVIACLVEHIGGDRIITVDIHSDQQQGFFRGPWDNLYGSYTLLPRIKKMVKGPLIVVSPDKGGTARANAYAKRLNADGIAIVYKERDTSVKNQSRALGMIGDVNGKNVLLVDDMIDTAGTIVNAAVLLKKNGANEVFVAATHGLFSGKALDKISESLIKRVVITDTVPIKGEVRKNEKIEIVSVAPLIAEVVQRTHTGKPLSSDLVN